MLLVRIIHYIAKYCHSDITSTNRGTKDDDTTASAAAAAEASEAQQQNQAQSNFKIVWHNLSYKVDTKKWYTRAKARLFHEETIHGPTTDQSRTCKIILNNVSGSISSGQLTAIMGPSGSGKTSLLNCLFQNQTKGVTGSILVDGDNRQTKKLKLCFIPQKDYLVEYLTVKEDLIFVSKLRNTTIGAFQQTSINNHTLTSVGVGANSNSQEPKPSSSAGLLLSEEDEETNVILDDVGSSQRNKKIVRTTTTPTTNNNSSNNNNNHVIDHQQNSLRVAKLLGLTSCLDVKIGKISGGQQKRLSIAREIMSNPDVLILDEPTTGLDSLSCLKTIRVLKDLALSPRLKNARPMAIVVVIHQPQREVFELFDKVYFISKGGNVIFDDKPQLAKKIIEEIGGIQLPNANYNPASFLIEIASGEMGNEPVNLLNNHQCKTFYSDNDINKLKQIQKQLNRNNALSNWKFCASDDRKLSDPNIELDIATTATTKTVATNTIKDVILPIGDNNQRGQEEEQIIAEEQQTFLDRNDSNNDDNNSTSSKNLYFISYQLKNCLRSHSTNSMQSFRHVFILTHRSWLSVIRNPSFSTTRLAFHLILPLTMVFIFGSDMGSSNACPLAESTLNILDISDKINGKLIERQQEDAKLTLENMCFFFVLLYGFSINIISVTATHYPLTLRMFKKETMNGLYTSGPYLLAQSLAELPLEMFFPTLSVLLAYPLTGQLTSYLEWRMIVTSIIVTLVIYTNHSLGHLCGSIFVGNINVAVIVAQATTLPFVLLSGFVVRISRMSYWLGKLSIISPYKLGLDGIMVARYGFQVCQCNISDFVDSKSVKIAGMTTQMRHVMKYLLERAAITTEEEQEEQNSISPINSLDSTNLIDSNFTTNLANQSTSMVETANIYSINQTRHNPLNETVALSIKHNSDDNFIDRMGQNLLKAQTYGLEMNSCQDVKPYALHIYNLIDSDLFISALGLILLIIIIKMVTFSIVKSYLYFNKP